MKILSYTGLFVFCCIMIILSGVSRDFKKESNTDNNKPKTTHKGAILSKPQIDSIQLKTYSFDSYTPLTQKRKHHWAIEVGKK